ncbi:hypothetical protein PIB30_086733, partial [Stylosanthes scabra]|nr:hypothetical protein [Stylosanthes scabra]
VDEMVEMGRSDECILARGRALRVLDERRYERKACYWKQMSRSKFANYMDKNTKFFHGIVKSKKRKKRIETLKIDGCCFMGKDKILKEVRRFFKALYTEDNFLGV